MRPAIVARRVIRSMGMAVRGGRRTRGAGSGRAAMEVCGERLTMSARQAVAEDKDCQLPSPHALAANLTAGSCGTRMKAEARGEARERHASVPLPGAEGTADSYRVRGMMAVGVMWWRCEGGLRCPGRGKCTRTSHRGLVAKLAPLVRKERPGGRALAVFLVCAFLPAHATPRVEVAHHCGLLVVTAEQEEEPPPRNLL